MYPSQINSIKKNVFPPYLLCFSSISLENSLEPLQFHSAYFLPWGPYPKFHFLKPKILHLHIFRVLHNFKYSHTITFNFFYDVSIRFEGLKKEDFAFILDWKKSKHTIYSSSMYAYIGEVLHIYKKCLKDEIIQYGDIYQNKTCCL